MRKLFKIRALGLFLILTLCLSAWAQSTKDDESPKAPEKNLSSQAVYNLVDCLNIALKKNSDIQVALKRIEEAEGARIEARAGLLPSVTSNAGALYREEDYANRDGQDPNRKNDDWNINIRVTQNIYSGGGVRSRFAISKLNKDAKFLNYKSTIDQTVMDVRIAFYEVLKNQADVEVRKQAVELLKQEWQNQNSKYQAGTVPRLNALRAEVALANEMPALIDAQNNFKNSMLKLSELLSIPYSVENDAAPFEVKGSLDYRKIELSLEDCLAKAESMRPELKEKELEIQMQEQQVTVERSAILPRVDLFAGYDLLDETDKTSPHDHIGGYVAGVAGTWHIFDGFATAGKIKSVRARLAAACIERDAARNNVQAEVRSAYLRLKQAEATVVSQEQNAALAQESFVLAQASFDAGLSSQLDIMQSRVDLTRARTNELNARFAHKVALARLQKAISSEFCIVDDSLTMQPKEETPQNPTINQDSDKKTFSHEVPLRGGVSQLRKSAMDIENWMDVTYHFSDPFLRTEEESSLIHKFTPPELALMPNE